MQGVAEVVGEIDNAGFEPVGVDVGDVVADDVHVLLETVQSCDSG